MAAAETPPAPKPQLHGSEAALGVVDVRRLWPEVLDNVTQRRRYAWVLLSQHGQVSGVNDKTLTLAMANPGARDSFVRSGSDEILRQSLIDVLGVDWRVETVVDPSASRRATEVAGGSLPRPDTATAGEQPTPPPPSGSLDGDADPADPVVDRSLEHTQLLSRELGAEVIEEITNE